MDKFPPRVGEVVLRPVDLLACPGKGMLEYQKQPGNPLYGSAASGDMMAWARRDRNVDNLWVIANDGKGMVCFVEEELPDLYTHFTITKVGHNSRNVHMKPAQWPMEKLLDLFTTPNEERDAHAMLVKRVMDILENKPDLLPMNTLVKRLKQQQLLGMCKMWFDMHRPDSPQEDRKIVMDVIRKAVGVMDT